MCCIFDLTRFFLILFYCSPLYFQYILDCVCEWSKENEKEEVKRRREKKTLTVVWHIGQMTATNISRWRFEQACINVYTDIESEWVREIERETLIHLYELTNQMCTHIYIEYSRLFFYPIAVTSCVNYFNKSTFVHSGWSFILYEIPYGICAIFS